MRKRDFLYFGNIDEMSYEDLVKTKEYVDKYLSSITCEAEMKMSVIAKEYDMQNHDVRYNFAFADKVYGYAIEHGKDVRGHNLVWPNHEPEALDDYIEDRLGCSMQEYERKHPEDFKEKRKKITLEFLENYIKNMEKRYPKCYCWDVINEVVPDMHKEEISEDEKKTGLRNSKWNEYIGQDEEGNDFYIEVLKLARKNLPENKKLFYNEYGEQHSEKRKAIIDVINKIKVYEQKHEVVLLDGVGLQSHYDLNVTEQQLEDIYNDFSAVGKEIQVTEVDITPEIDEKGNLRPYNPDNIDKYAKIWGKIFELSERYDVQAFTGWGVNDNLSWFRDVGCTMIGKDGQIKDFAKEFIEKTKKTSIFQDFGKISVEEYSDVARDVKKGNPLNNMNRATYALRSAIEDRTIEENEKNIK